MRMSWLTAAGAAAVVTSFAAAQQVQMFGGQTSVLLDLPLLESAASLTLTGASDGVVFPGNLGDGSVGFVITPPIAQDNPTTFGYNASDFFGTLSGSIHHRGTITFNDAISIGNFEILFDGGFKVADTFGGLGVLFDVDVTSADPGVETFLATGDLLVSASFAQLLLDLELAEGNLTGANVGSAFIQGFNMIPAPGALALIGLSGLAGARRRRR